MDSKSSCEVELENIEPFKLKGNLPRDDHLICLSGGERREERGERREERGERREERGDRR
jgi:hypothetical protein